MQKRTNKSLFSNLTVKKTLDVLNFPFWKARKVLTRENEGWEREKTDLQNDEKARMQGEDEMTSLTQRNGSAHKQETTRSSRYLY
jgi:hypothetical protein